ncbi:MAG TPA: CbiX/SirB N-terminal domain-containing protein [Propionibacteriaceae bacterium]
MSAYDGTVPVIGLAHGSRHPRGGEAIEQLMRAVGELVGGPSRVAYLDLAQPDLEAVAAELAAEGHRRAVVVPLLFTVAFHATVDVPEAVAAAAESSGLELMVSDILGTGDDVAEVLTQAMADAGIGAHSSLALFAVGSSNPAANAAVADLATRLGVRHGTAARAAFGTCAPRFDAVRPELADPVAIVPLFLAEGLLLDPMRSRATEEGWLMSAPLADLAAPIVRDRYDRALTSVELG